MLWITASAPASVRLWCLPGLLANPMLAIAGALRCSDVGGRVAQKGRRSRFGAKRRERPVDEVRGGLEMGRVRVGPSGYEPDIELVGVEVGANGDGRVVADDREGPARVVPCADDLGPVGSRRCRAYGVDLGDSKRAFDALRQIRVDRGGVPEYVERVPSRFERRRHRDAISAKQLKQLLDDRARGAAGEDRADRPVEVEQAGTRVRLRAWTARRSRVSASWATVVQIVSNQVLDLLDVLRAGRGVVVGGGVVEECDVLAHEVVDRRGARRGA